MPALSSSPIDAALEQLSDLPAGDRALLAGQCPSLAGYLARVPDPRDPRGVGHTLTSLVLTAVAAVLAGARSFTAVGEWVADAPPQVLASLGVRRDPLARRFRPPDEATIRWVLEAVDAAALDAAVGSWLAGRLRDADQYAAPGQCRRRVLAVDGKSERGTIRGRRLTVAASTHKKVPVMTGGSTSGPPQACCRKPLPTAPTQNPVKCRRRT